MEAVIKSRNQKPNTRRTNAKPTRLTARTTQEVLDAIDSGDLSEFTPREKAIIERAGAWISGEMYRSFIHAVRQDVKSHRAQEVARVS